METFGLVLEALEAPAVGFLRERSALKIWAALHGVVMLAEQGLLTGQVAHMTREELVEDIVAANQTGAVGRDQGGRWQAVWRHLCPHPHPEERRLRRVSKDEATVGPHGSRRRKARLLTMRR